MEHRCDREEENQQKQTCPDSNRDTENNRVRSQRDGEEGTGGDRDRDRPGS